MMDTAAVDEMARLEDTHWWFVGKRLLVRSVLAEIAPGPTLDLGCGTGAILTVLAGRGPVTGVDGSPEALAHCRRRGPWPLVRSQRRLQALDDPCA